MNFNSIEFFIFFPTVTLLYYLIPKRFRVYILLFSSYFFYMSWKVEFILLIIISTISDYLCSLCIHNFRENVRLKLFFLYTSVSLNLSFLLVFKYFNFFIDNINYFGNLNLFQNFEFILPVGISFYTFQTMGYTIDVYMGKIKAEKNFLKFAAYVCYFPQLVAGPIERANSLMPQILNEKNINLNNLVNGARIMLLGFFKKMVIADNISKMVDPIFSAPHASSLEYLLATYLFAFQIYLDFSGYTDIAVGTSRIFGIKLRRNFRTPYFSLSIKEFWSRWHISLSTWFRDYVYIPLGGNHYNKSRVYINLLITFLISGFWHGANWTFLIWGLYNGLLLVFEKILNISEHSSNKTKIIKLFCTFNLICIGWIFF